MPFYHINHTDSPSPSNVSAHPSPQHGVLNVTWVAPQVDPGLILMKYSVKYSKSVLNEFSEQVAPGSSTSLSISGLQLGIVYSVKVAAITPLGVGDYSILFNAKTFNGEITIIHAEHNPFMDTTVEAFGIQCVHVCIYIYAYN